MSKLQLDDIQGIILHGYGALDNACFLLLHVTDPRAAKRWLGTIEPRNAERRPEPTDTCVNIAFTPAGLEKLGLPKDVLAQFALQFLEGVAGTEHRRRILGDHGASAPERWRWGGPKTDALDMLLMLYARDETALRAVVASHTAALTTHGIRVVQQLDSLTLPGRKEHFGFRDGISQPGIEGYTQDSRPDNMVAAGEFLLGYHNAYGQYTDRPLIAPEHDPQKLLPNAPDADNRRDLGMNGTYVVFRQLGQDVHAFWNYCADAAPGAFAGDKVQSCVALASKMVGRWPSGAPLVNSPDADDPRLADDNAFVYVGSGDIDGLKCPIGSHVRRCHPRDALDPEPGSERSIEVGKRHRIIRRGRAYGRAVAASMDPRDIVGKPSDGQERGLHFICFNTHIARQYEFIQYTWANSPKFDGLYEDDDPLIGDRGNDGAKPGGVFTVQREPVRKRFTALPRFVTVHGGGYFFMPGIRALRYLATLK